MVLGEKHLATLNKVNDEGPVDDGLHKTATLGLRNGRFIKHTPQGYILTEKGEIALKVYGDMDTKHRELLMRIYSAKKSDHKFPIASAGAGEELYDLLELELIEVYDEDFLRLTSTGIKFWETTIETYQFSDKNAGTWNQPKSKTTRARKKQQTTNDVGTGFSPSADSSPPQSLHLQTKATPSTAESSSPRPEGEGQGVRVNDCETCINKQVLDMIAAKHPEVAELRDTLLRQQELMKKLNLD